MDTQNIEHTISIRLRWFGVIMVVMASLLSPSHATTFTVTNLNDSGAGSLRQAVLDANALTGDDTITFQSGLSGTILLTGGELAITGNLTVNGPGANILAISANHTSRIINTTFPTIGTVTLSGLRFKDGNAASGGAIYNYLCNLTVTNSTLSGNSASGGGGGGIYSILGNLTVTNSTLSGNSASGGGGGIHSISNLTVTNSTLSGNSATDHGGGIYNDGGTLIITNSTLSGNSAVLNGGGIANYGALSLGNALVAGNSASVGTDIANFVSFTSKGHNLFGENGNSGLYGANPVNSDLFLSGSIRTAIGPLTYNGGPTPTHLPVASSLAINHGNNALIPPGVTTDQRGYARIANGTVDIGAVEVSPLSPYNPIHSDLDGNGTDDLAGLTAAGGIYYSTNLSTWTNITGVLAQLVVGDFNGDGRADLAGLTSAGGIYYSTNLATWNYIPGQLNKLVAGNFNGDTYDDLAGLTNAGQIYYSTNLNTWTNIPGTLSALAEH